MLSQEERERVIKLFEGLRVTDINDGMDAVGLQDVGIMPGDIRPLWRDLENFAHRIYGFAHTVQFLPTNRRSTKMPVEDFTKWVSDWYGKLANAPRRDEIRPHDVIVIDGGEIPDCGFIGSYNSLEWVNAGAVGAVTNGGCRDTDEIIRQRVPVYSRHIRHGIRPGRVEVGGINTPVNVGGVMVRPGDFVAADGDGVVVVPIGVVEDVAAYARRVQDADKKGRRGFFDKL
ncbi:MAG: RraA family protein, partial [Planctomycetota bacterium]